MNSSQTQISESRQILYYGGMALSAVGLILFLSVFVQGCQDFSGSRPSGATSTIWVSPGTDPSTIHDFCGPLGMDCNANVQTTGSAPPVSVG